MEAHPRAGRLIKQSEGYRAFLPAPLPPDPPLRMEADLLRLLSEADQALGRLDGMSTVLPNPDLFVAMYVRHEAVLSSQIEGTQSTLEDVLEFEIEPAGAGRPKDVAEVVNYVRAMNHGLARLAELPLCLRLLREIHGVLLEGVRGGARAPGEFRRSQNWIGPAGCTLADAEFVPPPPHEILGILGDLERFLHDESLPPLVHCALAHAQFETIHPFLDGNGRLGRLLITFLLCQREVLRRPLLYLSYYLKAHRTEYYDRLTGIRSSGDWEGWLRFFLRGVLATSRAATDTAGAILRLAQEHRNRIAQELPRASQAPSLLDYLFEQPILMIRMVEKRLDCTNPTAAKLVQELERIGLLREVTGQRRNRRYAYQEYLDLFQRQVESRNG